METPERDILLARVDERQKHMNEKIDVVLKQLKNINDRLDGHDEELKELHAFKNEHIGFFKGSWKTVAAVGAMAAIIMTALIEIFLKK